MNEGIVVASPEGKLVLINSTASELFGNATGDVIGEDWTDRLGVYSVDGKDDLSSSAFPLGRALAGERVAEEELYICNSFVPDGVIVNVNAAPIDGISGREGGAVAVFRDVTQRTRLEGQLRQSQKMESVGQLAAGVAHDFNNLLTVINGYASMAQDLLHQEDPIYEMMQSIYSAGNRASGLTRQLLAFSRKQILSPSVVDINALIGEMQKMLSRLIGEDIELTFRPGRDIAPVFVDSGQIEQVIMNLVINSRDAMPDGGEIVQADRMSLLVVSGQNRFQSSCRPPRCLPSDAKAFR